ncbi:PKD domain-containing protein [Candidatus Bipolaricaulota bacterium]|nr:PKD domain-containing protein [Candidatus Bipolaricaulota bacterium]
MNVKRAALLIVGLSALVLAGCFGPIERPIADFTWCPYGFDGALDYQFTSTSTTIDGHYIVSMRWEFDDGTPSEEIWEALHRYTEEDVYHVTLTVTDTRGISGTVTKDVPVRMAVEIYPNWKFTLGSRARVTGIVANRADVHLDSVVVKAKFYDTNGIRITDGTITLFDLEPGEKVAYTVEAAEYSASIFHATVGVDSFVADCPNSWYSPVERVPAE